MSKGNHRWSGDKCMVCGLVRERREKRTLQRTYSRLGRDGVWYDVPIYTYGLAYWYGLDHQFIRPSCTRIINSQKINNG